MHSFDGESRQWNVSNNNSYIQKISANDAGHFEKEILTENNRFNEYILTSLRTIWGINLDYLNAHFNTDYISIFNKEVTAFIKDETIILKDNAYILTNKGKLLADKIASDLFV